MTGVPATHHRGYRGASDDWLTPPELLAELGPFDLDPCATSDPPWATARRMVALPDDGLDEIWTGYVWLNPPYGPDAAIWVKRLAAHGDGIALLFVRSDTRWWHDYVFAEATAILFLRGRLKFHHPDGTQAKGNAGNAHALVAYGRRAEVHLRSAHERGVVDGALVSAWRTAWDPA